MYNKIPQTENDSPPWHKHVSLTILFMAVLSAVGVMLAGNSAHRAVMERTEEIIEISRLLGDRNYIETLKVKHELLEALDNPDDLPGIVAHVVEYINKGD